MELGGYSELTRLANGGSSTVYRAIDPRHGRAVAIKVLNETADEETSRQRFRNEIAVMAELGDHPGIVTILDSGFSDDGQPFLVTPLYRHGTYADLLATQGPLPWFEACELMGRAANALSAVHQAGYLHRDIKPANIFVGAFDSGPVLSDFGLSSSSDPFRTVSENPALTVLYAAPEMLDSQRASQASDIYTLGATLYTLINGHPAYWHESSANAMRNILDSAGPPRLSVADAPSEVVEYVAQLMDRTPELRPSSAMEVARRLTAFAAGETATLNPAAARVLGPSDANTASLTQPVDRFTNRAASLSSDSDPLAQTHAEISNRRGSRPARMAGAAFIFVTVAVASIGAGYLISTSSSDDSAKGLDASIDIEPASASASDLEGGAEENGDTEESEQATTTQPTTTTIETTTTTTIPEGDRSTIEGMITDDDGTALSSVLVGLFEESADGSRGEWIRDERTEAAGTYDFTVKADCYVITLTAPEGRLWTNGSMWIEKKACLDGGQTVVVDGALAP